MDGSSLTKQQRDAINARDVSVALSAGAGCGKTFVLTERFLSHLQPGSGFQLSELAAITFTERAAREMRDRIRNRCHRLLLEAASPEEADHWLRTTRELESARISTIHAFCASLLRAHAVEAGLDPQFRTLDQTQAETLLAEVIDDELRTLLASQHEPLLDLIVTLGLRELKDMLRRFVGQRDKIDFDLWLGKSPDDLLNLWAEYHQQVLLPQLLSDISNGDAAMQLLAVLADAVPSNAIMQQRRQVLIERLPKLAGSANSLGDLQELRDNARVQGGGGKAAWPDESDYEAFRNAATKLRSEIDSVKKLAEFHRQAAKPAAVAGLQLLETSRTIVDAYASRKAKLACLDFDDLLIGARDLLLDPGRQELRDRISRQIRLLLVDEFQDTDPLQVDLVKALCGKELKRGKLFFVGDFKQSIYRFRRADPRVFRSLRDEMPPQGRLPLTRNFRSQSQILAFVNALFCEEFSPDYEPLRAHRPQISPTPVVEFLWSAGEDPHEAAPSRRKREALWIARRLRELLDGRAEIVWDEVAADQGEPAPRAIQLGDIALLFRALSEVSYYEDALRQYGIDYYLVGGRAFYAQQEVFDLLNLLRTLEFPSDAVSLAGVLRSPFFSLADESLFWLAKHPQGLAGGLFAEQITSKLDADQRHRAEFAAATLLDLRTCKDRLPIAALIEKAMKQTGYDAVLLAEFMGERKLANLRKLIDEARNFDQAGMFILADFITQLSDFVAKQPDEPLAATMPESTDVVRLMTVHQAKGLEFPLVVIPDLERAMRGSSAAAVFNPEIGPLVRMPENGDFENAVTGYDFHNRLEANEDSKELIRLFYVAATRAADYLILSSGVSKLGAASRPWMSLLAKRFDLLTGELREPLAEGEELPQIRVTTTAPPLEDRPKGATRPSLANILSKAEQLVSEGAAPHPPSIEPIPADAAARREYSFSRLSGALESASLPAVSPLEDIDDVHNDVHESRVDALGLGTLVHAVLEEVDFNGDADSLGRVQQLVGRYADVHLPGDRAGVTLAVDMIKRLLRSELASKLAAAKTIHRELEFLLAWPPGHSTPSELTAVQPLGGIYLRGYIDCLFQDENDAWHLLDYKTNVTSQTTLPQVAANYEMQMLLYALAVETVQGRPPQTLGLYFLRVGKAYYFDFNDAARGKVVTLVNQAITSLTRPEIDRASEAAAVPPGRFRQKNQQRLPGFSKGS